MNIQKFILTFLILILINSCDFISKEKGNTNLTNEAKSEANKEISSIIEISNDTIIACLYHEWGIIISKDGGKTWNHLAKGFPIRDITVTDKGLLVGILSFFNGSALFISKDFGLHWVIEKFNSSGFCPTRIISKPKEQLVIQTLKRDEQSFNNTVYRTYKLTGTNFQSDWSFLKTVKEKYVFKENQLSDSPYEIVDWNNLVKRVGKETKQIIKLYTFTQIHDIIYQNDIVNIVGENMIELVPGEKWDCKAYYGQYNKIWGYREFRIQGSYCSLKKSNSGNIYITSPEGLFKEEKGKIIQLY